MSDKNSNRQFSFTLTKDRKTTTADTGNIIEVTSIPPAALRDLILTPASPGSQRAAGGTIKKTYTATVVIDSAAIPQVEISSMTMVCVGSLITTVQYLTTRLSSLLKYPSETFEYYPGWTV
jgi:hypothetical protein